MFGQRLELILEPQLSFDQAGFRKKCSTVDHVFALAQVAEKVEEYRQEVWVAVVDFMKAFDSIEHEAIWTALSKQGVCQVYIRVLQNLYRDQQGQVNTDKPSRKFPITRGTKQGDPLSTLLFNAVVEDMFRDVREKWSKQKFGIEMSIGGEQYLQSLSFADDVLLAAASSKQITAMLEDVRAAAAERGLTIHPDKTKVLTNASKFRRTRLLRELPFDGKSVEVLGFQDAAKYLGCKFSFHDRNEKELSHRISAAWAAFSSHKVELTNKRYPLRHRLRLFNATVGATVLYACECWTLRLDQQRRLRKVQRCMLRMVIGAKRRILKEFEGASSESVSEEAGEDDDGDEALLEPWPDFLTRTARLAEEKLEDAGQAEWLELWRRRQWKWAARLVVSEQHIWACKTLLWDPVVHSRRPASRAQSRPRKRWSSDFCQFLEHEGVTTPWDQYVKDPQAWLSMEDSFVIWCRL